MEKKLTGYPSIDKPWLKYYSGAIPATVDPDCSMWEFLRKCNQHKERYFALNYFGRRISYGELFNQIDRVACALRALGVKPGDVISICPLNTPEFIFLLYATNKIGAVSNWIGITSPISDLHQQLKSTGSRIVFTVNLAYPQIAEAAKDSPVEKIINVPLEVSMPTLMKTALALKNRHANKFGIAWSEFLKCANNEATPAKINSVDTALIEYTGGSTGVPKGVMLSTKAMNSYYVNCVGLSQSGIIPYREREKLLCGVPLFLAFGASSCCHGPLCHSMELVLAPDPSPDAGIKIIIQSQSNHIVAGRVVVEALVETAGKKNVDLSFIRSIIYGGEETNKAWEHAMTKELMAHHVNSPLLNGYGMTETSAAILVAPDNETDGLVPFSNVNIKIVDPDNEANEYSYNTEGELCLSADTLMLGYFGHEAETKSLIFEEGGVKWLKTHDLATISPDGIIRITGRIKRIYSKLTSDGIQIRVYPMRIEEALIQNELVRECAVIGVKDDVLAYRSVAYIRLSDESKDTESAREQLDVYCRANLPESHWPDEYHFIDAFPTTRAGKVDYRTLEKGE